MPELQAKDIIPVRFPPNLGMAVRVKVASSPHYRTLTQFICLAVREKLAREFVNKNGENEKENSEIAKKTG